MATFKDLERFVQNLPNQIKLQAAQIIAETATEDFKQNFTRKGFGDSPWQLAKNTPSRGALMVRDSHLVNSIKTCYGYCLRWLLQPVTVWLLMPKYTTKAALTMCQLHPI